MDDDDRPYVFRDERDVLPDDTTADYADVIYDGEVMRFRDYRA